MQRLASAKSTVDVLSWYRKVLNSRFRIAVKLTHMPSLLRCIKSKRATSEVSYASLMSIAGGAGSIREVLDQGLKMSLKVPLN